MQDPLQLYRPKDPIVVNTCNHKQVPMAEDLPLHFRKDKGIIQVRWLRTPSWRGFFVKNERLPIYNFPLVEYIYCYHRYDLNIPTANRRSMDRMRSTKLTLRDVWVANFQFFGGCDSTTHKLHCTDNQLFRNADPRNDFARFRVDELLKLVRIQRLQDGLWERCIALLW